MRNRKGEEKKNQIKIRKTRPTEIDVGRRSALTCMRWSTLDDAYKIYYTSPSIYILFGHWQLPPTPLVIPPYAQQFLRISAKNWGPIFYYIQQLKIYARQTDHGVVLPYTIMSSSHRFTASSGQREKNKNNSCNNIIKKKREKE